ncbi:MAG TPA: hypothetical protein VMD02_04670 [Candidatus Omnitrophota bacterium]|nr:hypothetical protein [Candidatus Omnitrophota bacterium]
MNKKLVVLLLVALVMVSVAVAATTVKKPVVPGGQNQLKGIDHGKVGEWLFNGTTKFIVNSVKYPEVGPKGEKPDAGKRWIAIEVEVKNAHKFTATYGGPWGKLQLVDKDDQLFDAVYHVSRTAWKTRESAKRLLPASGLKALYLAQIPEDFTPVRMIYIAETGAPVYRVDL